MRNRFIFFYNFTVYNKSFAVSYRVISSSSNDENAIKKFDEKEKLPPYKRRPCIL